MGKEKYKKEIDALFKKSAVVSYDSIARIIKSRKKVRGYVKRIINYLIKKGRIKRITKGYYTIRDNSSLAVLCFQPAYLGLQDALSFHNLWEQETIPIIITSRNIRTGIRKILEGNVLIKKLNKKYFFGIEYAQEEGLALPYSDKEKTFIDLIYFRQMPDKKEIKEIYKKLDKQKLKSYLRVYPKRFKDKINKMVR